MTIFCGNEFIEEKMLPGRMGPPFRVVTIGDPSVGKTSITSYLFERKFTPNQPSTVGANYQSYTIYEDNENIELQIWDTAGQERFKSLGPVYFRNAAAAIVVFSLINKNSFMKLDQWISSFKEVAGPNAVVYVAANKADLVDNFEISVVQAEEWAIERGIKYYVTSAKTGQNIVKLFTDLAVEIMHSVTHFTMIPNIKIDQSIDQDNDTCC